MLLSNCLLETDDRDLVLELILAVMDRFIVRSGVSSSKTSWQDDGSNYQLEITIPAWLLVIIPLGGLFAQALGFPLISSSKSSEKKDNFSKSFSHPPLH